MALDIAGSVAKGGEAAEQQAKANRPSGGFEKINWFGLKDGETVIVRMLDDHNEWPSVLQHSFVPTKGAPANATEQQKQNWPKNFGAVCRKTPEFTQFFPDGCYICDHMSGNRRTKDGRYYPATRLWARAVERERVFATKEQAEQYNVPEGSDLGIRDREVEIDELDGDGKPTGKKTKAKKILVMNMPLKNFFGALKGYGDVYGTVLDRDYHIKRKGEGVDTDYEIVPLDPTTTTDSEGNEVRYDMRGDEVVDGKPTGRTKRDAYLDSAVSLFKLIEDRLDDDLYNRFFDARVDYQLKQKQDDSEGSPSEERAPAAAREQAPDPGRASATKDKLAAMRAQVKGEHPTPSGSSDSAPDSDGEAVPAQAGAASKVSFD